MPKVSDEYRATKHEDIVEAAMRAFLRKGFHAASMADIIAESGLSAGAIYGHFTGKSQIVLEVASRVVNTRIEQVEELATKDPMPPPATLIRIWTAGLVDDIGRPDMLVQLWGESVTEPEVRKLVLVLVSRLRAVYRSYISLGQQRRHGLSIEEADEVAAGQVTLFVSCAQGFILQSALLDDFDREGYLANIEKYLPQ
jgi:AcrR family transcriptional regulator